MSGPYPSGYLAAQIFVETGDFDKAQALAGELAKSTAPSDDSRVYSKIIDAQIALTKKDPRQAIKILLDANNMLDMWLVHFTLGRAYLEAGDFVQGIERRPARAGSPQARGQLSDRILDTLEAHALWTGPA